MSSIIMKSYGPARSSWYRPMNITAALTRKLALEEVTELP